MFSFLVTVWTLLHVVLCVVPEPSEYILSFPNWDNPQNISVISPISKNYMMLIGDWGAEALQNKNVQKMISNKMNAYYAAQLMNGYNLLSILSLGDNFYYTGQDCYQYNDHWSSIYGINLTNSNINWLATMGNHDWGDSDQWALCAFNAPSNKQYIDRLTNIPYAANQLNVDKGGCNPSNYYLPDFGYFYSINALSLELIVLEESSHDCSDIGGGYGSTQTFKNCGGFNKGCKYLGKITNATEELLINRAKISNATNILIMQHYPNEGKRLIKLWNDNRMKGHENDTVWSVFGHSHIQKCNGYDTKTGECNQILSGGGGGCCMEYTLRGFYVIGFNDNAKMIQPLKFNDTSISCQYPCDNTVKMTPQYMIEQGYETCCHTMDANINCQLYDLKQCNLV